jgi:hypothetical protein
MRPESDGGIKRLPCCRHCNFLKDNMPPEDWFWFIGANPGWWRTFTHPAQVRHGHPRIPLRPGPGRAAPLSAEGLQGAKSHALQGQQAVSRRPQPGSTRGRPWLDFGVAPPQPPRCDGCGAGNASFGIGPPLRARLFHYCATCNQGQPETQAAIAEAARAALMEGMESINDRG